MIITYRKTNDAISTSYLVEKVDQQLKRECSVMVKKCLNNELGLIFNKYFEPCNHIMNTRNNMKC